MRLSGSVQFQGSRAYPVASMLVMPGLQATVVMALSKREKSVTAVVERFRSQGVAWDRTMTPRTADVRQDAPGGHAVVMA